MSNSRVRCEPNLPSALDQFAEYSRSLCCSSFNIVMDRNHTSYLPRKFVLSFGRILLTAETISWAIMRLLLLLLRLLLWTTTTGSLSSSSLLLEHRFRFLFMSWLEVHVCIILCQTQKKSRYGDARHGRKKNVRQVLHEVQRPLT